MDNCIFITHQLFEIAKENEEFSRFMVTAFLFNSIILTLPELDSRGSSKIDDGSDVIH